MALLTDFYELAMAQAYWKAGLASREAVFYLNFRNNPFGGGFAVACGITQALDYLAGFGFAEEDLDYLTGLRANDGSPLFEPDFLSSLASMDFACDVDAVPDGCVVFAPEPLVRVRGPILQAQLIETALLNALDFQTLVATKAARIKLAARGKAVLEFGLRRAQGIDGGLSASRAAYIGGCDATSNTLAGKFFGIPVRGTQAHSMVMLFENELEAFEAFAAAQPDNCVLLVDTYDSLTGVRHAIEIGRKLAQKGHNLAGIRLDSGDLAFLSIEARRMLDEAGFQSTSIVASNDLDETVIESLIEQGAAISQWGVGTRLATAAGQPALGAVYKLSAVKGEKGWIRKQKLSEQRAKTSFPGILQIRRFIGKDGAVADMIWDELLGIEQPPIIVDPLDPTRFKHLEHCEGERCVERDLLIPMIRGGRLIYHPPPLETSRALVFKELSLFQAGIKRFVHPHQYPAGLEKKLHELWTKAILAQRKVPR